MAHQINPEDYCTAPADFDFGEFAVHFPPRAKPNDKADLGEDVGRDAFLIATARATREPHAGPAVTPDTLSAPFCSLLINLARAVRFVDYVIETRLRCSLDNS